MGSATVVYELVEDADKAIEEYNNASLDERVLIVEHDLKVLLPKVLKKPVGKTLRVGGGRGAAARR